MSDGPGRFSDQFNLRLPDGMRDRLKAEAEANKRSMNAEIVARLEASLGTGPAEAAGTSYAVPIVAGVAASTLAKEVATLVAEQFRGKFFFLAEGEADAASRLLPPRMPQPHQLPDGTEDAVRRISERLRAEAARRQRESSPPPEDKSMEEIIASVRRILRADNSEQLQESDNSKKAG